MAQINTDDQPYLRLGVAQRRRRQSFDLVSFIRFGSSPLRRVSSSLCYSTSISSHRNSGKKQATIKIRGLYEEVKLIANTVHRRFLHRHLLCRSGLVASQRISWKTCGVRYRPCPVVDGKLIVCLGKRKRRTSEEYTKESAAAQVRRLLDIVACTTTFGPSPPPGKDSTKAAAPQASAHRLHPARTPPRLTVMEKSQRVGRIRALLRNRRSNRRRKMV